ncbi:MAG: phosphatase PAP2 family protein, partial [Bacteroidota bacterium]
PPSGELEGDKSSGELEGDKSSGELEGDKSSGELEGDKSSGELEGDKSSGELEGDKSSGRLGGDIPGFLLVIWAVTISLAQIYMAKHWPTDILGGWLVGAIAAWVILLIYKRWILPKLD